MSLKVVRFQAFNSYIFCVLPLEYEPNSSYGLSLYCHAVPVTFVDYYRADYGENLQFYFVFVRESLSGDGPAVS